MIALSKEIRMAMQRKRAFYPACIVTFPNGGQIILTDDLRATGNGIVTTGGGSDFPLGLAISKQLTLSLLNHNGKYDNINFYNADLQVFTQIQRLDGTFETISHGNYTVVEPEEHGEVITIKGVDYMSKADATYKSRLAYPATVGNVYAEACQQAGLTPKTANIPNRTMMIQSAPEGTCRDVIGLCALYGIGNAVVDEHNQVKILSYVYDRPAAPLVNVALVNGAKLSVNDMTVTVSGLVEQPVVDTQDVIITGVSCGDKTYGTDEYMLVLTNEYAPPNFLDVLGPDIVGLSFRPFEVTTLADPSPEFMDFVLISDHRGKEYLSFITDTEYTFLGHSSFKCTAQSANPRTYTTTSKAIAALKKGLSTEVSARTQAIQDLSGQIADASGLYTTVEDDERYLHDRPNLLESNVIVKITNAGVEVSASKDSSGKPVYSVALDIASLEERIEALERRL